VAIHGRRILETFDVARAAGASGFRVARTADAFEPDRDGLTVAQLSPGKGGEPEINAIEVSKIGG